jgi:glycosyltransferase involved in cell wall biosynthesis
MRLVLDGLPLTEPLTGVGRYTYELAYALATSSVDDLVEVVSPLPFTEPIKCAGMKPDNLLLTEARVNRLTKHWWAVGLPLYLARSEAALFHGTNFDLPFFFRGARVLTVHDLSTLLYPQTHRPHVVSRARWRLPLMIKSATYIIVPTTAVKRELTSYLKVSSERIAIIPEAPRKCFTPMPSKEAFRLLQRFQLKKNYVLFVGTIEPRKNLSRLLDAFELLVSGDKDEDLQLVIAGRYGWMMGEFCQRLEILKERGVVKWLGYVSDEELRALYSACRIFIYPSLYEGFGLPLLEAMSCGAPVIAGRNSAILETVGEAALVIDPMDVRALSEGILILLKDESKRRSLSTVGLRRASLFTWEKTAHLTYDVYMEALKEVKSVTKKRKALRGVGE